MTNNKSITTYLNEDSVKQSIENALGQRTQQFITTVSSLVSKDEKLQACDKKSLMSACLTASSLDLPINQNLGFAYIIPYYDSKTKKTYAQFQMGYKGFIQLAQRSGQFVRINATDVREGELKHQDMLTGDYVFEWLQEDREKAKVVGYVAYMQLTNGFSKTLYMSNKELEKHGLKYSATYKRGFGLWKTDFNAMAQKTVLKMLLSKYAPLTTDMQKAQVYDQAVVVNEDEVKYIDNQRPELLDLPKPDKISKKDEPEIKGAKKEPAQKTKKVSEKPKATPKVSAGKPKAQSQDRLADDLLAKRTKLQNSKS